MLFTSMVLVYRPPTIKDEGREAGYFPKLLHTTGTLVFPKAASIVRLGCGLAESPLSQTSAVTIGCRGFESHRAMLGDAGSRGSTPCDRPGV
jgi:hypothetical protein